MDLLRGLIIVLVAVMPVLFLYLFAMKHWWLLFGVLFIPFMLASLFACWVIGYSLTDHAEIRRPEEGSNDYV